MSVAPHRDGHLWYPSGSLRYLFLNLFPPSQICLCFLRLVSDPPTSLHAPHVVTVKQINIEWPPSFLLSFAKLEIFDIVHHKKKK